AENLIGDEGQGFEIAMYGLDQGRFTVAAGACGVIRACLERSVEYARERETFGQPIGKYQFVQDMVAEMVLGYETSKLLVMQAAWMKNEGKRNTRETSLAKWHATESAFKAAHLAIQVHGSYGYAAEYGIERYFRNARNHGPNWTDATTAELRERVEAAFAAAPDGWVADGNYESKLGDLVVARADTFVWLDLPLALALARIARRTAGRIAHRTDLWNGNRETVRNAVLARDNLFAWAV